MKSSLWAGSKTLSIVQEFKYMLLVVKAFFNITLFLIKE